MRCVRSLAVGYFLLARSQGLAVNAVGAVRLKTTPLLSAEKMDQAAKKSATYRPPGA
jgi:hypothetical protein